MFRGLAQVSKNFSRLHSRGITSKDIAQPGLSLTSPSKRGYLTREPPSMAEKSFWDSFYIKHNKEPFEWLVDYEEAEQIASSLTCSSDESSNYVLDCGCGTSLFSYQLIDSFKRNQEKSNKYLVCADFSYDALELLRNKQIELRDSQNVSDSFIDFVKCDCKRLPFRDDIFDLIIDKGYLDSLLKEANSNHTYVIKNTIAALQNLLDKLDKNENENSESNARKQLIQITDEDPELRLSLLDQFNLESSGCSIEYSFKEITVDCHQGKNAVVTREYLVYMN